MTRQASGAGGPGNSNRNYDVSTLFDKELQRAQQSNYETKNSAEPQQSAGGSSDALDKIKDLARRQDELLKKQQELARDRGKMTAEEIKRQLEQLTREQSELRQRAEEMGNSQQSGGQKSGSGGKSGEAAARCAVSRKRCGTRRASCAARIRDRPARAEAAPSTSSTRLNAKCGRGRNDARRSLGDKQLEARQLADAQRQLGAELDKAEKSGRGTAGSSGGSEGEKDTARRLAGEQERLAERTKALQEDLKRQAAGGAAGGDQNKDKNAQAAAGAAARQLEQQRLAERMQQAADAMRGGGQKSGADPSKGAGQSAQEMARALDKTADTLAGATATTGETRKLSEQLARAQQLRERLDNTSRAMEKLGQQGGRGNGQSAQKTPGETGRSGQGQSGNGEGGDPAQLREQYARQLKETQDLLDQMQRDDPTFSRGGVGFTFEGQGMTLSAPGTEAFKQDFAKWQDLRRQATTALDRVESTLSKKLQAQESKDRLAAGVEDKAPAAYQKQVDSYFKALAAKTMKRV